MLKQLLIISIPKKSSNTIPLLAEMGKQQILQTSKPWPMVWAGARFSLVVLFTCLIQCNPDLKYFLNDLFDSNTTCIRIFQFLVMLH